MPISRPYIPMSVRVAVAERQVRAKGSLLWALYRSANEISEKQGQPWSLTRKLRILLGDLFPYGDYQLDHDPALILRPFKRGKYTPDANDPNHLVYRTKASHLQKTIGRKPDAMKTVTTKGSDIWLKSKFNRLEGRTKRRPKQRIQSRPFQKGRGFRGSRS